MRILCEKLANGTYICLQLVDLENYAFEVIAMEILDRTGVEWKDQRLKKAVYGHSYESGVGEWEIKAWSLIGCEVRQGCPLSPIFKLGLLQDN